MVTALSKQLESVWVPLELPAAGREDRAEDGLRDRHWTKSVGRRLGGSGQDHRLLPPAGSRTLSVSCQQTWIQVLLWAEQSSSNDWSSPECRSSVKSQIRSSRTSNLRILQRVSTDQRRSDWSLQSALSLPVS
ncbi:hypothetical protein LDENG_00228600 [Lucifuga dentata]|nr:hypothetical protein LDENG_00228600 [Lucifuga dentata]